MRPDSVKPELEPFVRARLEDDERIARRALPAYQHVSGTHGYYDPDPGQGFASAHVAMTPRRALAEIAAKRALLDAAVARTHTIVDGDCWFTCPAATEERDGGENCNDKSGDSCDCGRDYALRKLLLHLAAPYEPHWDYRNEWRGAPGD